MAIDDILAGSNTPFAPVISTEPSLAELKIQKVQEKIAQKQRKMAPTVKTGIMDLVNGGVSGVNELDLAEASLYRAGGNLADVGKSITNKIFGTNFDDSEATGWSRPADPERGIRSAADEMAGVSLAYRQKLQEDQDNVLRAVADRRWGDAALGAIAAGPRTLADSAATVPELAIGAAGTSLFGLGVGVAANRARKIFNAGEEVVDRYNEIKDEAKYAKKAADWLATGAKSAGSASVLTADIVQQQRNEYIREYGTEPSAERLVGMTALTLATTAFQLPLIKKFYVPDLKVPGTKKEFDKELKRLIKYADSGVIKKLVKRVVNTAGNVAKAGGAEAVQEFAQTWAEILGTHAGTNGQEVLSSAWNLLSDKDKQDEAITAAFLGGAAGGTAKVGIDAPIQATGAAVDVTAGTARNVAKYTAKKTVEKSQQILTPEQRQRIKDESNVRKAQIDELKKRNAEKYKIVARAKSFSEINDEEVRNDIISRVGNRDISDPRVFKTIQKDLKGIYPGQVAEARAKHGGKLAYAVGKDVSTNTVKKAAQMVNISEEDVDRMIKMARITSKKAIRQIKDWRTSPAIGLVRVTADHAADTSRKGLKKFKEAAMAYEPELMRDVADTVADDMPLMAQELRKYADEREQALKTNDLTRDSLINEKSLPLNIRESAKTGTVRDSDKITLGADLLDAMKGTPEDIDTVDSLLGAVKAYRAAKVPNGIAEATLKNYETQLKEQRAEFEKAPLQRTKDVLKTIATKSDETVVDTAAWVKSKAKDSVATLDKWAADFIASKDSDNVKAEDTVTDPDTKKLYRVKRNEQGEVALSGIKQFYQATSDIENSRERQSKLNDIHKILMEPNTIKKISEAYETTDPDAILAILKEAAPSLKKHDADFKKAAAEALKDSEQKPAPETRETNEDIPPIPDNELLLRDPDDPNFFLTPEDLSKNQEEIIRVMERSFEEDMRC